MAKLTLTGRKQSEPRIQNVRPLLNPPDKETIEALRWLLVDSVQKDPRNG